MKRFLTHWLIEHNLVHLVGAVSNNLEHAGSDINFNNHSRYLIIHSSKIKKKTDKTEKYTIIKFWVAKDL